jgi:flagellar assembly factor FliW
MQFHTRRFGVVDIEPHDIFSLPHGIPGFPSMRRAALFQPQPEFGGDTLFWLQDLDDGELAFLTLMPWDVFPEYDIEIDERLLGIDDADDVLVLNLVTVRRNGDVHPLMERRNSPMTVNLRAPLVVDTRHRRIQQVILTDTRWSVYEPLASAVERVG